VRDARSPCGKEMRALHQRGVKSQIGRARGQALSRDRPEAGVRAPASRLGRFLLLIGLEMGLQAVHHGIFQTFLQFLLHFL
jgi:hypothetical protein